MAQHHEESASARDAFELALRVLADDDWPLLRAELHLRLGGLLTGQDQPAAIAEARAAHLIYDRLGSPEAAVYAASLEMLTPVQASPAPWQ